MDPGLILPFVTETAYVEWAGLRPQTLHPAEQAECCATSVFPADAHGFYDTSPRPYTFPAVTLTKLRDVVVRGRSNLLTAPEGVLRPDLIDLDRDIMPEEFYGRLAMSDDGTAAAWTQTDPFEVAYLPEAADFTDGVSFNYAHWLTEVLPRLAAFVRAPGRARTTLIVDAGLHPNILRSIALLAPEATIHPLAPNELVRVGRLHHVSAVGYVPFKLRPQAASAISHGRFSQAAIQAMAEELRAACGVAEAARERPLIFIRRRSHIRHIVNEAEIADALAARGFTIVEPDGMSFDEQVAVFSNARLLVTATGAAATNLIFCRLDCPIVVLLPKLRFTAHWYWRAMAPSARLVHVTGAQIDPAEDPFHPTANDRDFKVELKDVLDGVDAALAIRP